MARFRLDERPNLRNLTRDSQVWLERIEIVADPEDDDYPIFYTEDYRQVGLVKLLRFCARKQST